MINETAQLEYLDQFTTPDYFIELRNQLFDREENTWHDVVNYTLVNKHTGVAEIQATQLASVLYQMEQFQGYINSVRKSNVVDTRPSIFQG